MLENLIKLEKYINSELSSKIHNSVINNDELLVEVGENDLTEVVQFIKSNEKLKFRQLIDIAGVDYPEEEKRFKEEFPEFHFKKTIQNNQPLSNKLSVSELSRYQKLIDLNQENIICGFYFPEALSGFDIPSQKQQMKELPAFNDVCLSGSLDICSALIGNPQMLVHKETYSPMICLTALDHNDKRITCLFKSYGPHLEFWGLGNQLMPGVDQVSEQWTGGLSFYKVISK